MPAARWCWSTARACMPMMQTGKAYLDFTSGIGVNALGYCHPAWVQAVTMQATRLQHSSNLYYTAPCGKLAKRAVRPHRA